MEHVGVGSATHLQYGIKADGAENLLLESIGVYDIYSVGIGSTGTSGTNNYKLPEPCDT